MFVLLVAEGGEIDLLTKIIILFHISITPVEISARPSLGLKLTFSFKLLLSVKLLLSFKLLSSSKL